MKLFEIKDVIDLIVYVGFIIGTFIVAFFIGKKIKYIGQPKTNTLFEKVPGHKDMVAVFDDTGNKHIYKLPKHPETKKQIVIDDVKSAGISKEEKEEYSVEIKHNPTNRFGIDSIR